MDDIKFGLIFSGFICAMVWLYYKRKFTHFIYKNYPEVYKDLGEPSLTFKRFPSIDESSALFSELGYLLSGRYKTLDDIQFVKFAGRLRAFFVFVLLVFISIFVFIFFPLVGGFSGGRQCNRVSGNKINIAYDYYLDGKFNKAVDLLNKEIQEKPDSAAAYFYRGIMYEKLNKYDTALEDFITAVELDPDYYDAYVHVDWHYARQQEWETITAYWDIFLENNPEHARAYLERAGAYYHLGDLDKAAADLEKACLYGNTQACQRYEQLEKR